MPFELRIKNIGKLDDAKIRIGQFTVFSGPNNTGKSFVSKTLYSLFNAMNVNPVQVFIKHLVDPLMEELEFLIGYSDTMDQRLLPIRQGVGVLLDMAMECSIGDVSKLAGMIPNLVEMARDMKNQLPEVRSFFESMVEENQFEEAESDATSIMDILSDGIDELDQHFSKLLDELEKNDDPKKIIASGVQRKVLENLLENFQVPNLSHLRGGKSMSSEVSIENIGKFVLQNRDILFTIRHSGLLKFLEYYSVVYLESPVYWKLKNALENIFIRRQSSFRSKRWQITGVPRYFYDLAGALKEEYVGEVPFANIYEELTGEDVIGGKIEITERGSLSFRENGRSFSLPITAMGVANLGILALLIERKVLNKNSFLFIDEPESHLHPNWQVIMTRVLFELAKGGVNVVIATHSPDVLKWLEVHIKNNPDDESLIALNRFPADDGEFENASFDDKITSMKQELTQPFADLFIRGL